MELTPEDDDLLSYFLSADVATEQLIQPKAEAGAGEFAFAHPMGLGADPRAFPGGGAALLPGMSSAFQGPDGGLMRSTSDDDATNSNASTPMDSDEKRQRRLARNRESARQSRRRKKQYLELLEEKVSQLTESIDATRASHLDRADEALSAVRSEILNTLVSELQASGADANEVSEKIRQGLQLIQERFGPNSVERNAVKDYNFRQLDNLLLPPYCRFLLWLSMQDDAFFDEATAANGKPGVVETTEKKKGPVTVKKDTLWQTLITELALTYEQDEKLKAVYKSGESKASKSERKRVAIAMTNLDKLKGSLEERANAVQQQTQALHSVLTPEQSLQYLRWVDMNQDRLSQFVDNGTAMSYSNENIQTILRKDDRDVTVEDVTTLLAELS